MSSTNPSFNITRHSLTACRVSAVSRDRQRAAAGLGEGSISAALLRAFPHVSLCECLQRGGGIFAKNTKDIITRFNSTGHISRQDCCRRQHHRGRYDLKGSPTSYKFPGVELHATAIDNLLFAQRVEVIRPLISMTVAGSRLCFLRSPVCSQARVDENSARASRADPRAGHGGADVHRAAGSFPAGDGRDGSSLLALLLSVAWSFLVEDRQARFMLKALSQYVSPQVAHELRADHTKLRLGTEHRELSILFSDIVEFTPMSERLEDRIGPLLNFYLDEMTEVVFDTNGTLDKYIATA